MSKGDTFCVIVLILAAVLMVVMLIGQFTSGGDKTEVRARFEITVPVMETVCVESADGYCKRYETRRIVRE